jgi:hypothetical protein
MKLEDFVSETLQEIIRGVLGAQEFAANHGGEVVPPDVFYQGGATSERYWDQKDDFPVASIEFNVAVTAAEESSAKGGAGVFVGPFGVGTQGTLDSANQSVSRIKFTVPMKLPKQVSPST